MDNGKSTLIKPLNANILAGIIFIVAAVDCLWGGIYWASFIVPIIAAVVFFFLDKNPFVRRALAISVIALVLLLVLRLILVNLIQFWLFTLLFWLVNIPAIVYLVLSAVAAFNGKKCDLPVIGGFIDSFCGC
ncbi:MAG: hypothetical protein IKS90_04055 [Clostridia bacterium]|nr:hypothetical protein [Clostridia bacterium]